MNNLSACIGLIELQLELLEQKMKVENGMKKLSYGDKFFLHLYLLINLDSFMYTQYQLKSSEESSEEILVIQNDVDIKIQTEEERMKNTRESLK